MVMKFFWMRKRIYDYHFEPVESSNPRYTSCKVFIFVLTFLGDFLPKSHMPFMHIFYGDYLIATKVGVTS